MRFHRLLLHHEGHVAALALLMALGLALGGLACSSDRMSVLKLAAGTSTCGFKGARPYLGSL